MNREVPGMFDGPILKLLARLSLPIFAGMLFQLLYNVTDTIWISRIDLSDPSYVGGTGIIFPILFLAIAVGNGIMVGTSSLVARAVGQRNYKILEKTAESGLFIALILSALLAVLCYVFDEKIISILGAEGDYFTHALEYFRYIIPAGILLFFGYVFFGIIQGEGKMKFMMNGMIIGTLSNIALDPIFIFVLGMDVKGAALATTLSQGIVIIYIISVFTRDKTLVPISWKIRNIDFSIVRHIAGIGFPQALGQALMAVSFLFFNRVVIQIDPAFLTSFTLCGRFDQVVLMPIFAVSASVLTMIGQNAGRGLMERVGRIWRVSLFSILGVTGALATMMVLLAPVIYPFFTDLDSVVNYAVLQTRVMEYSFMLAAIGILGRSVFQAAGHPMPALVLTVLRLVAIAIPAVYLYVYVLDMGAYGVWLGIITGNVFASAVSLLWIGRFLKGLVTGKVKIREVART